MLIALLLCLQQATALYFQSYGGTIDGMACVDSGSGTMTFPSVTVSAPYASEPGTIGLRQIAFQRIQDGAYDNQGITVNGVNAGTIQTCCVATSCEAATQYPPWSEGECGLSWCGTENHWEYIDFTTSSLYSTGVPQGSNIIITFTNPMAMVDTEGNPIMALSYDIIAPSISPSPTHSLSPTSTQSVTPSSSESSTITSTTSITPTTSPTLTPTSSITPSESITPTSTSSITPTESITPTSTSSITPTQSITPSESITPTSTSSVTPTQSITPSVSPSQSITPSITPTYSPTGSITPTISSSVSSSKTRSPPSSSSVSPTISPSGICYSVSTQHGIITSLSSGWIIVVSGVNVSQAYGGGYISMGNFQSCQMNALNKCVCSYTQGSTVAGCSGKRNSYITYSYGSIAGITYTNESPTCSYNFAGTIGVPSSETITPTLTRSIPSTPTKSHSLSETATRTRSRTISTSPSQSTSFSVSVSMSRTATPTTSLSPSSSVTPSPSVSTTPSQTRSITVTRTRIPTVSISPSTHPSMTSSPSWNSSATSTPLYYIAYYPSSSPTDHGTVTPTPLFMMTPWPSNGTHTATSTPLFMKIYYPSVSPIVNYTYSYEPEGPAAIVVAAIGVGMVSVAAIGGVAYQLLKKRTAIPGVLPDTDTNSTNRLNNGDDHTRIEFSTSDLKEIEALLIQHRKQFKVL